MNHNVKLGFLYQHVLSQISGLDSNDPGVTGDVISRFIQPLGLTPDANILDLGSGPGHFLDHMRQLGYGSVQGVTLDTEHCRRCRERGHTVRLGDPYLLPERDESQDLLFCQRSLEHSVMPYITLLEYNRVLRPQAWLYAEVADPEDQPEPVANRGSFSMLSRAAWINLLYRAGFDIQWHQYQFQQQLGDGSLVTHRRCIFMCQRRRPVDIK